MNIPNLIKVLTISSILMVCFVRLGNTQEVPSQQPQVRNDFNEDEYNQFVSVSKDLLPLQQDADEKMMNALGENDLEMERFQELFQAQQQGTIRDASDDPAEIANFNKAGQQMMKIQEETGKQIEQKITESGMDVNTFRELSQAYQQNPEVRQKVDGMIQREEQ